MLAGCIEGKEKGWASFEGKRRALKTLAKIIDDHLAEVLTFLAEDL